MVVAAGERFDLDYYVMMLRQKDRRGERVAHEPVETPIR
jgi:hypothetical protein